MFIFLPYVFRYTHLYGCKTVNVWVTTKWHIIWTKGWKIAGLCHLMWEKIKKIAWSRENNGILHKVAIRTQAVESREQERTFSSAPLAMWPLVSHLLLTLSFFFGEMIMHNVYTIVSTVMAPIRCPLLPSLALYGPTLMLLLSHVTWE